MANFEVEDLDSFKIEVKMVDIIVVDNFEVEGLDNLEIEVEVVGIIGIEMVDNIEDLEEFGIIEV